MSCPGFHLKYTFNGILRLCQKMLQYHQYSIHSKYWLLVEDTSAAQNNNTTVMLIWCLKQLKVFILKFSISGSSIFWLLILVSFPPGGCFDEVSNNWAHYHEYKYDLYFLQYHTLTSIIFMNHEQLCQIIRTIFNIYIFLNHCWWKGHNQS